MRAFDASRVKITTHRDHIRKVAARFLENYGHDLDSASWRAGKTRRQIYEGLAALDTEKATAADVAAIIGNGVWIGEACDFCGDRPETWLEIGEEPDYEARYLNVCIPCAGEINAIALAARAAQGTEARRAETATKIGGSVHDGPVP